MRSGLASGRIDLVTKRKIACQISGTSDPASNTTSQHTATAVSPMQVLQVDIAVPPSSARLRRPLLESKGLYASGKLKRSDRASEAIPYIIQCSVKDTALDAC